jgi:hypothetical protein
MREKKRTPKRKRRSGDRMASAGREVGGPSPRSGRGIGRLEHELVPELRAQVTLLKPR